MTVYEELVARGLIAQVTDEEERLHFTSVLIPRRTAFMWDISWRCA